MPSIGSTIQRTPATGVGRSPALLAEDRVARAPWASSARMTCSVSVSTTVTGSVGVDFVATASSVAAPPPTRTEHLAAPAGRAAGLVGDADRDAANPSGSSVTGRQSAPGSSDSGMVLEKWHAPWCLTSSGREFFHGRTVCRQGWPMADVNDPSPATAAASAGDVSGRRGFGVDIGGSGVKGGLVDLDTGELIGDRIKIETPHPATPDAVADTVARSSSKPAGTARSAHAAVGGHRRHRAHRGEHRQVVDRHRRTGPVRSRTRRPVGDGPQRRRRRRASPRTATARARTSTAWSCC